MDRRPGEPDGICVPENDDDYHRWLLLHPGGFVLSVRGRRPVLHHATCIHIDRHNNAGALIERRSHKVCAGSRNEIRDWLRAQGYGPIPVKCGTCAP